MAVVAPKLTFGALNLIGTDAEQAATGYQFQALGADTDWANPVPIEEKIISWLQDGAIVEQTGLDNREMNIQVRIKGDDLNDLAVAESALMLETGKRNLLTWTPPDALAAQCVFNVVTSNLLFAFDDFGENFDERVYALRVIAEPTAMAAVATSVTVPAPSGTQTLTLIDNCNSTTNWTQTVTPFGGSPATTAAGSGGTYVYASTSMAGVVPSAPKTLTLTRASLAQSLSGTPYIRVECEDFGSFNYTTGQSTPSFKLNGIAAPIAAQQGNVYWFDANALGISTLTSVAATIVGYFKSNATATLAIHQVDRSNVLGEVGTKRQLSRTIPVGGSARAQGNIALEDASSALGSVLVYTCPTVAGQASPNLRQYKSLSGTTSTDANSVSGFTNDISSTVAFDVPAGAIVPGGYLVMARLKYGSLSTQDVTWSVVSKVGGNELGQQQGAKVSCDLSTTFGLFVLGSATLPGVKVGTSGVLQFTLSSLAAVIVDEMWFFNLDTGDLTWVECRTTSPAAGAAANRLWLDAPTVDYPAPNVLAGFAADRSDAYFPPSYSSPSIYLRSFGQHEVAPPSLTVFTVTSNSTAAALTLSYFRRFHTHAVT